MLKKPKLICIFSFCLPLLGQAEVDPICNASDCHKPQFDIPDFPTCEASDVVSLTACLNQASMEDLIIDLNGASITINAEILINNVGFSLVIQNGSLSGDSSNFRILSIAENSDVTLRKLTIENGHATGMNDDGGGIFNQGALHLWKATIIHNQADTSGGGIYNGATGILTIRDSLITDNSANADGGGNSGGGGIFNIGTITFIVNTTISGNTTRGFGAGINNQATIEVICSSTISDNLTCISVPGSGECEQGQNPTGAGGGIFNETLATIKLVINSTIAKNISLEGGGIFNNGAFGGITNSTIARNKVNFGGGGIYNNTGGVISELTSDIVAENIDTNELTLIAPDLLNLGSITAESYNLIGNNAGVPTIIDGQNNDIVGEDAHLLDLQDNGGRTFTMGLDPRSRAINNGLNPHNLNWDQRGDPFDRVALGRPDIGAFEFQRNDCCRKPCPEPIHDDEHHEIGGVFFPGLVPTPVPPPPVLPPPPEVLLPPPSPEPIVTVVPAAPVPAPLPAQDVEVIVTKDNPEVEAKFGKATVASDKESEGCSTTGQRSSGTHLMLLIAAILGALRNLQAKSKRQKEMLV